MNGERYMEIIDAKNRISQIDNELEYLKEKKVIKFEKTQPGSPKLKDIVEGKSNSKMVNDKYTHFVIKDTDIDNEIIALEKEKNSLDRFILNELERLVKYDEIALMGYYREIGKSWKDIDIILHRSKGYSRLKYFRAKKLITNDNKK